MKLRTLMVALGLLGVPGIASADGMSSQSAHCAVSPTWSGVYAGFYAGGAWAFPFVETFNTAPLLQLLRAVYVEASRTPG